MSEKKLAGMVTVVTGGSRGAGRGVAVELGAAGATVYVTGRTTRDSDPGTYGTFLREVGRSTMPGSVDETADEVTRAGGTGIAARCDHTREEEVRDLFARVEREQGRLDLLVNNAWGGHETFSSVFTAPFWERSIADWDSMFERGVRNHVLASRFAAPMMVRRKTGLIVTTTFWDRGRYLKGNFFYDLAKSAMNRLAEGMAEELRPHGVTSVAVSPGFMRTELVLAHMRTDEAQWREQPALARTESPRYLGRAVAALASDRDVMSKSGRVLLVGELAREYGFTDVDGRQPPPFEIDGDGRDGEQNAGGPERGKRT